MQNDLKLGKLLGSGGFGSVYKATLSQDDGSTVPVIVKKVRRAGVLAGWLLPPSTDSQAQNKLCSN